MWAKQGAHLLTEALAGPPVWLLESGELDVGVQPQSVIQVCRAALWLADDVEIRKAAHAVELAAAVNQVFPESAPHVLEHGAEAPGVASV